MDTMLGILVEPGLIYTLIPVGIIALGFVTFEIAMAITISTLPRSRFQQKWTAQEQRRVLRVFCVVFCVWPVTATLIVAHVYFSTWIALIADVVVLALIAHGARWLVRGMKQSKLIQAGHCIQCFYDLRASHDSDHCPECGTDLHDHPARVVGHRSPSTSTPL